MKKYLKYAKKCGKYFYFSGILISTQSEYLSLNIPNIPLTRAVLAAKIMMKPWHHIQGFPKKGGLQNFELLKIVKLKKGGRKTNGKKRSEMIRLNKLVFQEMFIAVSLGTFSR